MGTDQHGSSSSLGKARGSYRTSGNELTSRFIDHQDISGQNGGCGGSVSHRSLAALDSGPNGRILGTSVLIEGYLGVFRRSYQKAALMSCALLPVPMLIGLRLYRSSTTFIHLHPPLTDLLPVCMHSETTPLIPGRRLPLLPLLSLNNTLPF